jgi:hypothetical protein
MWCRSASAAARPRIKDGAGLGFKSRMRRDIRPPASLHSGFPMPQTDLSDDQHRRLQFRRLHEDFMRAESFTGWTWPEPDTGREADADQFERWLIERWLAHVRSPEFQHSADYHFLRAEWEHGA